MKVKEGATEEKCVAGPVVTGAQASKNDKVHPLKVRQVNYCESLEEGFDIEEVFRSHWEADHQRELRRRVPKKNGLFYRKHQETKMRQS